MGISRPCVHNLFLDECIINTSTRKKVNSLKSPKAKEKLKQDNLK
jgi:hypothetical protein